MLGIRASHSGAYLLLLLKGAPAEMWAMVGQPSSATAGAAASSASGASKPWRVRLVDLPFSSVEWVLPDNYLQHGKGEVRGTGHNTSYMKCVASAVS